MPAPPTIKVRTPRTLVRSVECPAICAPIAKSEHPLRVKIPLATKPTEPTQEGGWNANEVPQASPSRTCCDRDRRVRLNQGVSGESWGEETRLIRQHHQRPRTRRVPVPPSRQRRIGHTRCISGGLIYYGLGFRRVGEGQGEGPCPTRIDGRQCESRSRTESRGSRSIGRRSEMR
jgi:hypothetical protein